MRGHGAAGANGDAAYAGGVARSGRSRCRGGDGGTRMVAGLRRSGIERAGGDGAGQQRRPAHRARAADRISFAHRGREGGAEAQRQHRGSPTRTRTLDYTLSPVMLNEFQVEFEASYELDVWGKLAAQTSAATAQYQAEQVAEDAMALSVAGSVASGYLN